MPPRQEMVALASFGDDPERIEVILPPGQPEEMLSEIRTKPDFHLFGVNFFYSYPPEVFDSLPAQPANTLVEITVPYCFHVPGKALFEFRDEHGTVYLASKKVWTQHTQGSGDADYRSPTHVLYHKNAAIQTPKFPHRLPIGPNPVCSGTNFEADRDNSGLYRYSLVRMYLDTEPPAQAFTSDSIDQAVLSGVVARAVKGTNRFIDAYRLATKSPHVQRLPAVHIRDIFFRKHNCGVHGASFGYGVRTAIMNRPDREVESIADILLAGQEIPAWDLLFLDAEASLHNNQFTLAVVNAFQALELALEYFLHARMTSQGVSSADIADRLGRTWRTKDRLRDLVPDATGRNLITDDRDLWERFCWAVDDVRNKLIHAARDLDSARTEKAVAACCDVHRWLSALP